MSSSNYRITLDMQSNQSQASLPVRLNDTNRRLYIILTNGGSPYIIEEGSYAVFMGNKPDGNPLVNDCTIGEDSVICYEFTEQTANVSGVVDCEIRLYDIDGKVITSPRFIFVVDERVIYDEEILSKYEGTTLDYILGSEMARQFAESDRAKAELQRQKQEAERTSAETLRANAEELRLFAEEGRVKAEEQRVIAEGVREGNETYRSKCESDRQAAEREREQASATMTSMFNIIIGKNNSYDVDSLGVVPSCIFGNLRNFTEGDVIAIANNDFDLICMGSATDEEMDTLTCYRFNDFLFGNITMTAGGTYIFVDGISRKFLATTEKFKLPIGQEEMDAHNNSEEAHSDIRFKADAAYSLAGEAHERATLVKEQCDKDIKELKSTQESTSNAIKGKASGEIVRVNDVSPMEHTVKCKVRSKNLFDNLSNYKNGTYTYSNETLTVTDRYVHKFIELEEGKTYTFSCKSTRTGADGGGVHIRAYKEDQRTYVDIQGGSIINLLSPSFTLTMPKGYPYIRIALYGHATSDGTGSATYTELMLEESKEATEYVPYIEPTTATVTRCSKNIIPYPYSETTVTKNGITFTDNGDGSITINGTATTAAAVFYLAYIKNLGTTILQASTNSSLNGTVTNGTCTFSGGAMYNANHEAVILNIPNGTTVDNVTVFPQAEYGTEGTEYELNQSNATYSPLSDGTVEGIKSVSPTMTLLTDTENVVVEVEYNQDINVLNKKLVEALDAIIAIQQTLIGGTSQ